MIRLKPWHWSDTCSINYNLKIIFSSVKDADDLALVFPLHIWPCSDDLFQMHVVVALKHTLLYFSFSRLFQGCDLPYVCLKIFVLPFLTSFVFAS